MSGDIRRFIEDQKLQILEEKRRLGLLEKCNDENKENLNENITKKEISFDVDRGKLEEEEKKSSGNDKTSEVFQRSDKEKGLDEKKVRISPSSHSEHAKNESFQSKTVPSVVEPLDFTRCYDLHVEKRKQALIDKLVNSEYPFSSRSDGGVGRGFEGGGSPFDPPILRRGEFAPPTTLRASPHEGLGEYEIRRGLHKERREREYLRHLAKKNNEGSIVEAEGQNFESPKSSRSTNTELSLESKLVQTDIQNINNRLVQYDLLPEKEVTTRRTVTDELVDAALRRRGGPYRVDQRLTSAQNEFVLRASASGSANMDKPKSILSNRRTGSPRDRYEYPSDLPQSSYPSTSFMDGFSYSDRSNELERERLKRETYQRELRLQIEEKRHLAVMREEQERIERELENKRMEQQLLRMQEEQACEEQRRAKRNELMRRHSDDLLRRKTELHEMQRPWRRHADSESCNLDSLGVGMTSSCYGGGPLGGAYSPPVSRRALSSYTSYNVPATSVFADTSSSSRYNPHRYESASTYGGILRKEPLRRMESANSYDTVPLRGRRRFDRFDSLSRIDSLTNRLETMSVRDGDLTDVQRRHSATQQDLSLLRKSPRLRRRNSSSRFEDSLPVPLLKARSPVAKELKNAVPFSSHRGGSEAMRRLEDRWQVPAVQKNIVHSMESPSRGSILTQLGSIRAQLQREQLRMDETLRRRGLVRQRTTEDY